MSISLDSYGRFCSRQAPAMFIHPPDPMPGLQKEEATMKRITRIGAAVSVCALAGVALAQPTITSLGSGTPQGVSNLTGGTYFVSGTGIVTTQVGRWALTPGSSLLTTTELGATGNAYPTISSDGVYQLGVLPNTSPQVFGMTASAVSPVFTTTPTLVASTTTPSATETIVNRWNSVTNTWTRATMLPTETRLCYGQIAGGVSMMTFGPGSSSGSTFLDGNAMSQNGRFVVGHGYISSYSTATGNTITASTSRWHPYIWDATTNTTTVLPVAARTSSNTWRPRTARAFAVSNDGLVVVGYQEHNVAATATADPDGARPLVWRWNSATSRYDMSYLPTGVNGGLVYTASATAGSIFINAAGTIIVGRNVDNNGSSYICKWTWDAGTSTWTANNLGTNVGAKSTIVGITCPAGVPTVTTTAPHGLAVNDRVYIAGNIVGIAASAYNGMWQVTAVPSVTTFEISGPDGNTLACASDSTDGTVHKAASWLPSSVYFGCGAASRWGAPPSITPTGMSDDGNTIVGVATYSTCGSFMSGGFIWHASDGTIKDWYDYCVSQNVPGITTYYAPIDLNNNPVSIGLPRLGNPLSISPDGTAIVGRQGGTQIVIPSAGPWIMLTTGGASCVPPRFTVQPPASIVTSLCASSFGTALTTAVSGTGPFTYQWYRGATALTDGPTGNGSSITGSTTSQLRLFNIHASDVGSYTCVATGCNGQTATSTATAVSLDPTQTTPVNNDCAAAIATGEATVNFNICAAYANQGYSCATDIASVWYRYTPTFTGNARFQTCASTFDTTLQLFDQCNGSPLVSGCNDDVGARGLAGIGATCGSTRSVISSFPVTAGVPFYVRVGAKTFPSSTTGSATSGALTISQAPAPPANDLCANAIDVSGNSVTGNTYAFNLNEATDDYTFGTDFCAASPAETTTASTRDVWFRLVAPCGGTYSISTCGSTDTNPMLHVMRDCFANEILACRDNVGSGVSGCTSQQARIQNLTITGTVLIRVSQSGTGSPGTAATSGTGAIIITGVDNPCNGACCVGSTCVATTQAACTGTFTSVGTSCNIYNANNTTPCCFADFNHASGLSVQDIFDFLAAWFNSDPKANINGGILDVQDIFDFLSVWFAGCLYSVSVMPSRAVALWCDGSVLYSAAIIATSSPWRTHRTPDTQHPLKDPHGHSRKTDSVLSRVS